MDQYYSKKPPVQVLSCEPLWMTRRIRELRQMLKLIQKDKELRTEKKYHLRVD